MPKAVFSLHAYMCYIILPLLDVSDCYLQVYIFIFFMLSLVMATLASCNMQLFVTLQSKVLLGRT
jgi:hypothetical protein